MKNGETPEVKMELGIQSVKLDHNPERSIYRIRKR